MVASGGESVRSESLLDSGLSVGLDPSNAENSGAALGGFVQQRKRASFGACRAQVSVEPSNANPK
jgi:hypothetical protein